VVASAKGRGAWATLGTAVGFGSFYVLTGLGQMLVIAAGAGNIDLSIPAMMTLSGYLGMGVMGGEDGRILLGLALTLGLGLAGGAANLLLIRIFAIPPMIATLAAGLVMQSASIAYSRGSTAKPPPLLLSAALAHLGPFPLIASAALVLSLVIAPAMRRSVFGRTLLALGQNARAAYLAGLRTRPAHAAAYLLSGVFAAFAGFWLAAYSGGASLNMAEDFLLMSIAVVVLGGSRISGGAVSVEGLWGAALLLYLIVTLLNLWTVSAGLRYVLTGLIILLVLGLSGER
jgi:ribose transport system permease protein